MINAFAATLTPEILEMVFGSWENFLIVVFWSYQNTESNSNIEELYSVLPEVRQSKQNLQAPQWWALRALITTGTQPSSPLEVRLLLSGELKAMLLSQECEQYFSVACAGKEIIALLKNSPEVHTNILAHWAAVSSVNLISKLYVLAWSWPKLF